MRESETCTNKYSRLRGSNNFNQHKLSLIRLIHIYQHEFDTDYGVHSGLFDELIQIQEEANDYARGKTISSYITWLESIPSNGSIEKQWNLLLKLFEIGMELDGAHGMSLTTQKMINWKKSINLRMLTRFGFVGKTIRHLHRCQR